MRYHELTEARPWKTYRGQDRPCLVLCQKPVGRADCVIVQTEGHWGTVWTGKQEVFHGYFVKIVPPMGEDWLGEDRHSIREALRQAAEAAEMRGWTVLAIGLEDAFEESGLSENSGFGYHPAHPDRAVHMLEPPRS